MKSSLFDQIASLGAGTALDAALYLGWNSTSGFVTLDELDAEANEVISVDTIRFYGDGRLSVVVFGHIEERALRELGKVILANPGNTPWTGRFYAEPTAHVTVMHVAPGEIQVCRGLVPDSATGQKAVWNANDQLLIGAFLGGRLIRVELTPVS